MTWLFAHPADQGLWSERQVAMGTMSLHPMATEPSEFIPLCHLGLMSCSMALSQEAQSDSPTTSSQAGAYLVPSSQGSSTMLLIVPRETAQENPDLRTLGRSGTRP
jgi:hypothetical protein